MPRNKFSSPTLDLAIKEEDWEAAKAASSGGCLIADAIKKQYPHLSSVRVDTATVRVSDRKRGLRFIYLTPEPAQTLLLSFDQGWEQTAKQIRISRAAQVLPITSGQKDTAALEAKREAVKLKIKTEGRASLTPAEKRVVTVSKKSKTRPTSRPAAEVNAKGVIHGGDPITQASKVDNPNLLRGRDRIYGAKVAKPAEVFTQAVDLAVAEKLKELGIDPIGDQA